jgi:diguanylate cyclase (GGDEF)-like protein
VEEARAAALRSVAATCAIVLLILAAMLAILVLLGRRIVTPVLALTEVITRLAGRDYAVAIPAGSRDEIGRMAGALETLRRGAIAAEQAEARIAHQARHDALTGLSNRVVMQERVEQAIAAAGRGQTSALLCLDLDRFKAVNDNFGHPVGDRLLRQVAERLLACVRDVDTVSRLGGDEFSVLLTCLETGVSAGVVAERIIRALCEPFDLDGLRVSVGTSVGIAVTLQDGGSADALATSADTALYRAKLDGKGCYRFFVPEMGEALRSRMSLEQDLRDAVRNNAFELLYQPQFHLETNRIIGFEALLRWRHPTRGFIAASEFMPLAEETRLIVPLGGWVLRQACADAMNWPEAVKLSVNLSVVQVRTHDLATTVQHALASAGLPASRLELEVTEAALLIDNGAALHALRDLGASLSMDNFGTLSSSLSHLQSFPFGKVKIDRSLIRGLSPEPRTAAIIRAVVGLGHDFGMIVSAVGVETPAQLTKLRREGCTEVQGNLCGGPIPAEVARTMAARGVGFAAAWESGVA